MASPDAPSDVLDWVIPLAQVPGTGKRLSLAATGEERAAFAAAAGIEDCGELRADLVIEPLAGGSYRVHGRARAQITQACSVTLEPVPAHLDEPVLVDFRPAGDASAAGRHEIDLDEEADIELIETAGLAIGRIVYECLASAIDPYPRKPNAALPTAPASPAPEQDGKENPFAVLARLKTRGPGSND